MPDIAKILEYAKSIGAVTAEFLREWNGWQCYEPIYDDDAEYTCTGLPLVIMAKGTEIRMSTPEEAMNI